MAQASAIAHLAERRRLLVAESGLLRRQVAEDVANLASTIVWVERGYSMVQVLRSFWPVIAAGAGFLVARRKGGWIASISKIWSFWGVAKNAARIWKKAQ